MLPTVPAAMVLSELATLGVHNDELLLRSLEFAREVAIVLLMLSATIIGLSVTFARSLFGIDHVHGTKLLASSWFAYLASILCGIFVLASVTGNLAIASGGGPSDDIIRTLSPYEDNIKYFSTLQLISFFLACGLLVVFGSYRIRVMRKHGASPTT